MRASILLIACILLFSSCEKDEIPVDYIPPLVNKGTVYRQIDMQSDYRNRLYYDLETDSVVAQHLRSDWDLAFSCGATDTMIRLNDSRLMVGYRVESDNIDEVSSTSTATALYDDSDGSASALDDWMNGGAIYVLYRGIDENGLDLGYYKVQLMSVSTEEFTIRYAPLEAMENIQVTIPKNDTRNFIHFSFTEGVRLLEPPKEDWDLLFTQYTYFFSPEENPFGDFELHYIVAGVLLNPNGVEAQKLAQYDFEAIDGDYLDTVILTSEQDVIGYDWKEYDIDAQLYTVLDNAYVVNTTEDNRYKLQFTSFIDADGERGAPTFVSKLEE